MSWETYLTFVAATVLLMALPGPNVALIVANSMAYGRRQGLVTVAGTSCAMVSQLLLAMIGMAGALTILAYLFEWLRWAGVAYLVYLAIQAWRAPPLDLTQIQPDRSSLRSAFLRGLLVSLTNPKTLFFYGAFFPQFVRPDGDLGAQLALLGGSFLAIAVAIDSCWALAAGRLRGLLAMRGRLRNRLSASFYLMAAAGLASARRSS